MAARLLTGTAIMLLVVVFISPTEMRLGTRTSDFEEAERRLETHTKLFRASEEVYQDDNLQEFSRLGGSAFKFGIAMQCLSLLLDAYNLMDPFMRSTKTKALSARNLGKRAFKRDAMIFFFTCLSITILDSFYANIFDGRPLKIYHVESTCDNYASPGTPCSSTGNTTWSVLASDEYAALSESCHHFDKHISGCTEFSTNTLCHGDVLVTANILFEGWSKQTLVVAFLLGTVCMLWNSLTEVKYVRTCFVDEEAGKQSRWCEILFFGNKVNQQGDRPGDSILKDIGSIAFSGLATGLQVMILQIPIENDCLLLETLNSPAVTAWLIYTLVGLIALNMFLFVVQSAIVWVISRITGSQPETFVRCMDCLQQVAAVPLVVGAVAFFFYSNYLTFRLAFYNPGDSAMLLGAFSAAFGPILTLLSLPFHFLDKEQKGQQVENEQKGQQDATPTAPPTNSALMTPRMRKFFAMQSQKSIFSDLTDEVTDESVRKDNRCNTTSSEFGVESSLPPPPCDSMKNESVAQSSLRPPAANDEEAPQDVVELANDEEASQTPVRSSSSVVELAIYEEASQTSEDRV